MDKVPVTGTIANRMVTGMHLFSQICTHVCDKNKNKKNLSFNTLLI